MFEAANAAAPSVAIGSLSARRMASPVVAEGASFEAKPPVVLFQTRIHGGGVESGQGRQYDVASNGRFLINTVLDEAAAPITVLLNWNPEPKK